MSAKSSFPHFSANVLSLIFLRFLRFLLFRSFWLWLCRALISVAASHSYHISTLLYCFNEGGEALLLKREREPNRGLWSPCGGKLQMNIGESPYACACREAQEEMGLALAPQDLRLAGIVSEHGYEGQAHWLMFLFEVNPRLRELPPPCAEGSFAFFPAAEIASLPIPQSDRDQIWPLFWRRRGGFFAAHCRCQTDGTQQWTIEETRS